MFSVPSELKKQEYEKKRKQYEAARKNKRKGQTVGSANGASQPKVKKRRNKNTSTVPSSETLVSLDSSGE